MKRQGVLPFGGSVERTAPDQIWKADVPERMQMYNDWSEFINDEKVLVAASEWIYNEINTASSTLFGTKSGFFSFFSLVGRKNAAEWGFGCNWISRDDILRFLRMHYGEKLDIPFIATYRKSECSSLLKDPERIELNENKKTLKLHKVLWTIEQLSRNWLTLQEQKTAMLCDYFEPLKGGPVHPIYGLKLLESLRSQLEAAQSVTEIDDVLSKLKLHYSVRPVDGQSCKRLKTEETTYAKCQKAGLWSLASKFGCSSEVLGIQLSQGSAWGMNLQLEDFKEKPEDMALKFTCAEFETQQDVLTGARHMVAVAISCEPSIRIYVRRNYLDILELSTDPKTPDRDVARDANFQRKPLHRFENTQWLLVQKAEEENLIDVTFHLPEYGRNKLLADFNKFYLRESASESAQLWNKQRELILLDAIYNFILPFMEKEARSLLTSRAKNWLLREYGQVLFNKVSMAPAYHWKRADTWADIEAAATPKVMACCWGETEWTLVMLGSCGEVIDVLRIGSYTYESHDHSEDRFVDDVIQQHYLNDEKRVIQFAAYHQPRVAIVGAVNMSCILIRKLVLGIVGRVKNNNGPPFSMRVLYGDESLARLYDNCQTPSDQPPGQSGSGFNRAVALGRYLQNPLAMVATLCGTGREILSWKVLSSPFEDVLTPDEKYAMIERVMVDVTNQVGFDTNLAIHHEWMLAPLQFVSGLGPIKAAQLQQSLVRSGCAISNRMDFVTLHGLGEKVYANAAGFLRVRLSSIKQLGDLLGDTRIHPESYVLAQELVKDVYGDGDALQCIRDQSGCLKNLDIEAYANNKNLQDKMQTLVDVRNGLIQGFEDRRRIYEELSVDDRFCMITGLADDTLCEGKFLQVKVCSVMSRTARCSTVEHGILGTLKREDFSYDDGRRTSDLTEKLKVGDIITCKIKTVEKTYFEVRFSSL